MADCSKCLLYDEFYDSIKNETDDVTIEGEQNKVHYYCVMYDEHIDDYFVHGKKCKHYLSEKTP